MRNSKGKVIMLIVPVILLVVLIFVYREYEKNNRDNDGPAISATISPTPEATPTESASIPVSTVTPSPTQIPSPTPVPTSAPSPVPVASDIGNSSGQKIKHQVYSAATPISDYRGKDEIVFGSPLTYNHIEGVTTYRGNNYRDDATYGTRKVVMKKLEIEWVFDQIGLVDPQWPGLGWTGQPLIVHWPEKTRKIMNLNQEFRDKDFIEVIQATLDGNIYFLDLKTGLPTRDSIDIGFPIKGTPAIDPRGYPILYTGMGINSLLSGKTTSWKYRVFSLIDHSELFSIPGKDPVTTRTWGAFDSTALLHAETDTLFQCGENGILYKIKLNTQFDEEEGHLSVNPETIKYKYTNPFYGAAGIESSPAIYRDLMFFNDNGGMLQCLDINTLTPKWGFNLGDDSDATPVIEETPEGVFVYAGNEVDRQGNLGYTKVRKINALTGEQVWERSYQCYMDKNINGGVFSAPAVGTGDIEDLVIFNIVKTGTEWGGRLVALDKRTGEEVWAKKLNHYGWSTPTIIKSDDGTSYMIFADSQGTLFLLDPKTGDTLDTVSLERNVEASPAVYDDMIVLGSYARKIFGVRIK